MKPGATVDVSIEGIGVLRNEFVDAGRRRGDDEQP